MLKIYEEYGLYQPNLVDSAMSVVERLVGKQINLNRERTPWKESGVYDENGKAKKTS